MWCQAEYGLCMQLFISVFYLLVESSWLFLSIPIYQTKWHCILFRSCPDQCQHVWSCILSCQLEASWLVIATEFLTQQCDGAMCYIYPPIPSAADLVYKSVLLWGQRVWASLLGHLHFTKYQTLMCMCCPWIPSIHSLFHSSFSPPLPLICNHSFFVPFCVHSSSFHHSLLHFMQVTQNMRLALWLIIRGYHTYYIYYIYESGLRKLRYM